MTSGVDNIPSFLIRDCCGVFITPLLLIFNKIIKSQTFPSMWKISKIVPVLKKGDPTCVMNYRPISILCNFAKILEMVIYSKLYSQLKIFISPFQHRFVDKKSTITNLPIFTQQAFETCDKGS